MDLTNDSILHLWKNLEKEGVDYIMIGGFAVNMNGFHRFTEDIDILISGDIENRKRFITALNKAGIGDFPMFETMEIIPGMTNLYLDDGMVLDIFDKLPGYENTSFNQLMSDAIIQKIEGINVRFLHINQLIATKRITARPKDLIDIIELEKIKLANL